jgi:hypothetical protein
MSLSEAIVNLPLVSADIWVCRVLIPAHGLKKADDRASEGQFYGFTKSRNLLNWLDPTMETVKNPLGARFLELDPT